MALFLVPPDFNPWDTLAARFWSVRGFEQAGCLNPWKGKRPAPGGENNRAGLSGVAFKASPKSLSLESHLSTGGIIPTSYLDARREFPKQEILSITQASNFKTSLATLPGLSSLANARRMISWPSLVMS